MPLIVICGLPSSGKSTTSDLLAKHFAANRPGLKCVLVSDSESAHHRNLLYTESGKEKALRGDLKSRVSRHLNAETLVILDSHNYIKGYRYELYCLSKEHKTTHCIVECSVPREEALRRNQLRDESQKYDEKVMDALTDRYEAPDPRNRWDKPLIVVHQEEPVPYEKVDDALFKRNAPPPNLSTQSQPLSDTNFLHQLDNQTKEIVGQITRAQEMGQLADITIPKANVKLSGGKLLTTLELNKLRRQFITYTKAHPVKNSEQIANTFVQYLNSSISE